MTPETSYGFDVIDFAREWLHTPLDPWEEVAIIRAGELLEDGITPRFRTVLILVARQNGKTFLVRVVRGYWLFIEEWPVIVGMSTDRNYAKKDWEKFCELAKTTPALRKLLPPKKKNYGIKEAIGYESLTTAAGCQYTFAALNRRAARSLSVDRLYVDELREHRNWDAWNASTNAMNARPYAQALCTTNQGDDQSIVLDSLRSLAIEQMNDPETDIGIFEWSPPEDADPFDPETWAYANPNLGRPGRLTHRTIAGKAKLAGSGPKELADFKTEVLCMRVRQLDGAIDEAKWNALAEDGSFEGVPLAAVLDISPTGQHATLVAAGVLPNGRVRVKTVKAWDGPDTTSDVRKSLRGCFR